MDAIRAWAATLCLSAIACSLIQLLTPKEGSGKIMRLLIAAFFLCAVLSPLAAFHLIDFTFPITADYDRSEQLEIRLQEQIEKQLQPALLKTVNEALINYHFSAKKAGAKMDRSEDGGIYISHIEVYLDKQDRQYCATAAQILSHRFGQEVTVFIE
ncbi:MAG: hypothetical protein FWE80_04655 [Oscillospiraceae bacterium]|nr:hypothetical protein [Oscillospiraceae bacterium]